MDAHGRATVYMAVGGKHAPKGLRMSLVPGDTGTVRVVKINRVTDHTEPLQLNHHYAVTRTATDVTVTFLPRNHGRGVCLTGNHHVLGVVMERTVGPDVTVARMYVKTKPRTPVREKTTRKRKRDDDDDAVTMAEFEVFKANITKRLRTLERALAARRKEEAQRAKHFEAIERIMRAEFMDEINALDRLNCPLPYAHA